MMNSKPDEKPDENPRRHEEPTGTVLRLVPRTARPQEATSKNGGRAIEHVHRPNRDGEDDDPGPTAA